MGFLQSLPDCVIQAGLCLPGPGTKSQEWTLGRPLHEFVFAHYCQISHC